MYSSAGPGADADGLGELHIADALGKGDLLDLSFFANGGDKLGGDIMRDIVLTGHLYLGEPRFASSCAEEPLGVAVGLQRRLAARRTILPLRPCPSPG